MVHATLTSFLRPAAIVPILALLYVTVPVPNVLVFSASVGVALLAVGRELLVEPTTVASSPSS